MNVVIISKEKYEEMVGKLNLLSDRVNEIIGKREKGKLSRWMDNQEVCQQLCISPAPCRRAATTERWLTRKSGIRFSTSRRIFKVLSGSWRTGARMPHGVAEPFDK